MPSMSSSPNFEVSRTQSSHSRDRLNAGGLLSHRSEFRIKKRNASRVRRWQCVSISYAFLILFGGLALACHSIYQMYVVEVFDKVIDSFDVTSSVELARKLPPVSLMIDQALLSLGAVTSWVILSWCVLGGYRKHRACITASVAMLFIIATVSMSLAISLIYSENVFLDMSKIPEIKEYGMVNSSTIFIDEYQTLLRRCGKDGAADYKGSPCFQRKQAANCTLPVSNTTSLPVSCCKNTTIPQCNHGTTPGKPTDGTLVYLRGCQPLIEESVKQRFKEVSALLFALASVVICGLPWLCCLYKAITDEKHYTDIARDIAKIQHRCHHHGTCKRKECHHSFPILAPPLHVQASRLTAWRSEPLPTIHRSSTIQRGSPFDEIPDTGPPTFVSVYSKTNPPMHSYPSYYTDAGGVLYPRPSMNKMGNNANLNNACLSQSNIKFPVASVVDPDTEITEGGDLPFEKLVVVPIQERRHKHRVRSAALYRSPAAPYHQYADMNMTPDHNLYGGYSGHHLYKSRGGYPAAGAVSPGAGIFHITPSSALYYPTAASTGTIPDFYRWDDFTDSYTDSEEEGDDHGAATPRKRVRRKRRPMRRRSSLRRLRSGSRTRRRRVRRRRSRF